ncbi:Lipin/Ned1/Smp2-domain-containing protein [Obelidium mucronatum]|nr:Lipin/Ned1/Smp2-domain-containing protein [Obelidium mucronatum]
MWKVVSSVASFYNDINPATLSGAIDIVVVRAKDGTLSCSPFHVRFGKLVLLRPAEKKVAIAVNGQPVDMNMKVGEAGEAFFVVEMDKDEPAPSEYATSPIMKGNPLFGGGGSMGPGSGDDSFELERGKTPTPLIQTPSKNDEVESELPLEDRVAAISIEGGRNENASVDPIESLESTTPTKQIQQQLGPIAMDIPVGSPGWQWNWGGLPVKKEGEKSNKEQPEFNTLDLTAKVQQQPPVEDNGSDLLVHAKVPISVKPVVASSLTAALREGTTPTATVPTTPAAGPTVTVNEKMDNYFSSLPDQMTSPDKPPSFRATSPSLLENHMNIRANAVSPLHQSLVPGGSVESSSIFPPIELSLCGKQALTNLIIAQQQQQQQQEQASTSTPPSMTPEQLFSQHKVNYDSFIANPTALLANPDLVFRVQDGYYDWTAVAPILVSAAAFNRTTSIPHNQSQQLSQEQQPRLSGDDGKSSLSTISITEEPKKYSGFRGWWGGSSSSNTNSKVGVAAPGTLNPASSIPTSPNAPLGPPSTSDFGPRSLSPAPGSDVDVASTVADEDRNQTGGAIGPTRYIKSLRMTSDQLQALNLEPGVNSISFTVTSRLQGTATCASKIFLWEHDTKVVISDVDGTITKSDVLGHVFTMVGQDWTHSGVASLYTNIRNNGYQILYLTSRAIGQANYTRDYLKKVEQGKFQLPEGPIVMSPDRLFAAFHREVIQRRPEEFKISCLRDIKRLFGPNAHPFYAGFGNRITDVQSYRAVEIPLSRIFTIDPSGDIKLEFTAGYKSSYGKLNEIVNHIFPPVVDGGGEGGFPSDQEFWEVWRQYLPEAVGDMTIDAKLESGIELGSEEVLAVQAAQAQAAASAAASKKKETGGGATVIEITANESGLVEVHSGEDGEDDDDEEYEEASGSDVTDDEDDEEALRQLQASEDDATLKKRMAEMKTFRY